MHNDNTMTLVPLIFAFVTSTSGVLPEEIIAQTNVQELFLRFLPGVLWFLAYGEIFNSFGVFSLCIVREGFDFMLVLHVHIQFFQQHLLSRRPFLCCISETLDEDQLTMYAWVYFWALYSVPLVNVSVSRPFSYCFDYYNDGKAALSLSPA